MNIRSQSKFPLFLLLRRSRQHLPSGHLYSLNRSVVRRHRHLERGDDCAAVSRLLQAGLSVR